MSINQTFLDELEKNLHVEKSYIEKIDIVHGNKLACHMTDGKTIVNRDPYLVTLAKVAACSDELVNYTDNLPAGCKVSQLPRDLISLKTWLLFVFYNGDSRTYNEFREKMSRLPTSVLAKRYERLVQEHNVDKKFDEYIQERIKVIEDKTRERAGKNYVDIHPLEGETTDERLLRLNTLLTRK